MQNHEAFVEAAAQIIPVLVLALLADPAGRAKRPGQSLLVLFALMAGLVGELLALLSIYVGPEPWSNGWIAWSMVILAGALLSPHAREHWNTLLGPLPARWKATINGGLVALYMWGYAAFLILVKFDGWVRVPLFVVLALGIVVTGVVSRRGFMEMKKLEGEVAAREQRWADADPSAGREQTP